jgi:hypothetical protein
MKRHYRLRVQRTTERRRYLFGTLINFAQSAGQGISDFLGPTLTTGLEGAALGAGIGALGSAVTGGNAGTGALIGGGVGGAGGLLTGALSSGSGTGAGPSASAGGVAAPASVPITDPTGGFGTNSTPGASLITGDVNSTFAQAGANAAPTFNDPGAGTTGVPGSADPPGIFSGISSFLKSNPWVTQIGIPAAGIGYEALTKPSLSSIPGYSQLQGEASTLATQGSELQSYLSSGTLPPGVQQSLTQAAASAKAAIRSQYAASGQSGSSAETADLANVDTTMASQGASIALNLLNSGVSESNLSSQLYSSLMQTALSQDQILSQAIGNLAGAAARPTINIQQPAVAG